MAVPQADRQVNFDAGIMRASGAATSFALGFEDEMSRETTI
jgi:hypothetical protein